MEASYHPARREPRVKTAGALRPLHGFEALMFGLLGLALLDAALVAWLFVRGLGG